MFTKLDMLLVIFFSLSVSPIQSVNAMHEQTMETENINVRLLTCKTHNYNKGDPYDFLRRLNDIELNDTELNEFSVDNDVAFSIILLIESIKKEVPIKWDLLWIDLDAKGASSISVNRFKGVVPDEVFTSSSLLKVSGKIMPLFPLVGFPPSRMGKKKGNYTVSVLDFKIDNKQFKLEKACRAKFSIR